ncbi:hypothetical protein BKA70DRAFT_1430450 [Coprinopsis sp. MPI-PUGE-AT-0042]|nr:hypothetical protein BKA70DRAFT_1430450 [Coprinopsis sp. MPI-PUGE-AT-0042]
MPSWQAPKQDQTRALEIDIAIYMIQGKSLWPGHWVSFARLTFPDQAAKRLRFAGCPRTRGALTIPQDFGSGGSTFRRISGAIHRNVDGHSFVTENVWFSPLFSNPAIASAIFPFHHLLLAGLIAPYGLFVDEHSTALGPNPSRNAMSVAGRKICRALGVPTTCAYPLRLVVDPSPRPVKE